MLGDHLLYDIPIGAAQTLLQQQFPRIGGLQNTVMQDSKPLWPFVNQQNIQIVHVRLGRLNHWIVVSTIGCTNNEIAKSGHYNLCKNGINLGISRRL